MDEFKQMEEEFDRLMNPKPVMLLVLPQGWSIGPVDDDDDDDADTAIVVDEGRGA